MKISFDQINSPWWCNRYSKDVRHNELSIASAKNTPAFLKLIGICKCSKWKNNFNNGKAIYKKEKQKNIQKVLQKSRQNSKQPPRSMWTCWMQWEKIVRSWSPPGSKSPQNKAFSRVRIQEFTSLSLKISPLTCTTKSSSFLSLLSWEANLISNFRTMYQI